jgi:co-chaperonin GroES (HSP10)
MKPKLWQRGASMGGETLTHISETENVRPLRDQIILHLSEETQSRWILVRMRAMPLEGTVLAIGPGDHPYHYDHPEKHKRSKSWQISTDYLKTEVKVGDRIKLGDGEISNNGFQRFWWGDKLCIVCSERDVAGIVDEGPALKRQPLRRRDLQNVASGNR